MYLKSTPEVVWHRMVKRNRSEESQVRLSYLKDIHTSYENWLSSPELVKCEVLTIDADKDLEDVIQQLTLNTDKILGKKSCNGVSWPTCDFAFCNFATTYTDRFLI